jgi:lipopolysaccharide/colanic/teichoic acid biosynthesis glycosyltransferase
MEERVTLKEKKGYPLWKRPVDLFIGLIAVLLLSPLFLVISILIIIDDGFPVYFIQKRVGKNGKVFGCVKFRTMVKNAENIGSGIWTKEDDPRITKVGKRLRSFIDELPQLFNVLVGSMSIVGPRPSLVYQSKRYDEHQKKRLLIKPGITGWAQINGRNELSWPEKIDLDVWYAEHMTFGLDMKIIFDTPRVLLKPNVYADAEPDDPISRLDGVTNPDMEEDNVTT